MKSLAQVAELELQVQQLRHEASLRALEWESNRVEHQKQLNELNHQLGESEKAKLYLYEQEKTTRQAVAELKTKVSDLEAKLSARDSELATLKDKYFNDRSHLIEEHRKALSLAEQERSRWQQESRNSQRLLEETQQELQRMSEQLNERERIVQSMLSKRSESPTQSLSAPADNSNFHLKQLQEQRERLKALESKDRQLLMENRRLRESVKQLQRLKEEKLAAEAALTRLTKVQDCISRFQAECALLRKEKCEWLAAIKSLNAGYTTPKSFISNFILVRSQLDKLQNERQMESEREKKLHSLLAKQEEDVHRLSNEKAELEQKLSLETNRQSLLSKQVELSRKEVNLLREQLRSFELEEVTYTDNFDQIKSRRIEELERLVDTFNSEITDIRSRLDMANRNGTAESNSNMPGSDALRETLTALDETNQKIQSLDSERKVHENEIRTLNMQIEVLERCLQVPDYDPELTRVLELPCNPSSADHKQLLETLKTENRDLRDRIVLLSSISINGDTSMMDGNIISSDVFPESSFRAAELEHQQTQQELKAAEKKLSRLKEVFTSKVEEFRRTVQRLLGFELEMGELGRVKVKSVYSSSDSEQLIFLLTDDKQVTLRKTDFVSRADVCGWFEEYVDKKGSVPAFLAKLTLELSQQRAIK